MLPALLIGFIACRTKSIFASMVTHGIFNASGDIMLHTRSLAEAVNLGWTVIIIILVIFAGVLILECIRHTLAKIPAQVKGVDSRLPDMLSLAPPCQG